MANRTPYIAITRGIVVSVETTYLEADSSPDNSHFLWAYRVTIENQGLETVQLRSRHWMITNARGELTEVKGPGVVGQQPFLKPGENHIEIHVYNTALNAWSALPPHDYKPLIEKYGDRFQMQDLDKVQPIPSGILGTIHLVTEATQ